jgi:putative ABC transport system permease protein
LATEVLALALTTLRARRVSFAGSLLAVSLGVTVVCATAVLMASALTASGAGRYAAADAVVEANARFVVGHGNAASVVTVHPAARLPSSVVAAAASVPGVAHAVGDLAFPATALDARGRALSAPGADRTEAHGWASASLTPYVLDAGRVPERTNEVVVDARLAGSGAVRAGQALRVITPAGLREFRVSGLARPRPAADRSQSALFFADSAAPAPNRC